MNTKRGILERLLKESSITIEELFVLYDKEVIHTPYDTKPEEATWYSTSTWGMSKNKLHNFLVMQDYLWTKIMINNTPVFKHLIFDYSRSFHSEDTIKEFKSMFLIK